MRSSKNVLTAKSVIWLGIEYRLFMLFLYLEPKTDKIICPTCKAVGRQKQVTEIMQYGMEVDVELELFTCLNCRAHYGFRHKFAIEKEGKPDEPANSK